MEQQVFEYDVCLSFAGEQRPYVKEVAAFLRERGVLVFYDEFEEASLWGKNLYDHLDDVYTNKAKYCVIFVSEDYAKKVWTTHERQSAQARAFREHEEYILPVRFDDSSIPGLRSTIGYLDALHKSPQELAEFIE